MARWVAFVVGFLAVSSPATTASAQSAPVQDNAQSSVPAPIPATVSPEELGDRIMQQAILQSVWGPPAHCLVRQSVNVFDKQLSGVGEFVRGGQGSGKLKFILRMPAADQLNTLLQVSDGQRLLSIEHIGEIKRRTEIDLGKIRPRLMLTSDALHDPVIAMYLAIGGQAEALRKIYQQYRWDSVRPGTLGDIDVWWITGRVSYQARLASPATTMDHMLLAENQSALLPTRIRLAIGNAKTPIPYWLYQVEQMRNAEELSPPGRSATLRIVTEWASPVLLKPAQVTDDLFAPPASNEPLSDETDRYLPPQPAVAGVAPPAVNR